MVHYSRCDQGVLIVQHRRFIFTTRFQRLDLSPSSERSLIMAGPLERAGIFHSTSFFFVGPT